MPASARNRRGRNNPYMFEELFGNVHRSAAGSIWRWRTEVALVSGLAGWAYWMAYAITITWTVIVLLAATGMVTLIPPVRRYARARFWCLITRHRLQRLCWEARLHTRSGRLPLILRIHPTEVGERAYLWCRAGISAEDFEAHKEEVSAACYARDARIARDKQRSHLVTIDVIRRDTLHATRHVSPQIIPGMVLERARAVNGKARVFKLASRFTASIPRWLRRTPESS